MPGASAGPDVEIASVPLASGLPFARRAVLLGPPGSGKGTQGEIVAQRLGIPTISTGELLRRAIASGNELGRRVKTIVATGGLVDDETMLDLVRTRFGEADASDGFLLDGYPRTVRQAMALEALMRETQRPLDAVILITVPEATLLDRLGRRGRADDREDVIRERLNVYREATAPLIAYYRDRGPLREVDGDRPVEVVTADILRALGRGSEA